MKLVKLEQEYKSGFRLVDFLRRSFKFNKVLMCLLKRRWLISS